MADRVRELFSSPRGLFWLAQLGGWGAYGLSTFLTLLPSLPAGVYGNYLLVKLARAGVGLGASLLLFRLYQALLSRRGHPLITFGVAVIACSLLGAAWLLVYRLGIAPALLMAPPPFGWEIFPRAALDLTFVLLAWSGVYFGARYWRTVQDQQRHLLHAQHLAEEARFLTLSYQLNPHFLFNSLNSIRALVEEDGRRAKEMVTELAELLRYTLTRDPAERVTLGQELEMISNYLAIEAIRFEDRLDTSTHVDPAATRVLIPSFLVHPLVENAIKHGSRGQNGTLSVRLTARIVGSRLHIEVANTGRLRARKRAYASRAPTSRQNWGTGIGWENIRGRLEHLYPGDHRFDVVEENGWVKVMIEVPAVRTHTEALAHA